MTPLPELTAENTAFWTGGERDELMIAHCDACDHAIHPPEVICPVCLSRSVTARPAKGTGTVESVTVNYQKWMPDLDVPYALAIVSLDGETGVRVTAQVVDIEPEAVRIGQKVGVTFEQRDDVWLPRFRPIEDAQ